MENPTSRIWDLNHLNFLTAIICHFFIVIEEQILYSYLTNEKFFDFEKYFYK